MSKNSNIVLIGFAGSGKTSVGRRLSEALGMGFYDTDEYLEAMAQMTISEIFASRGEAHFRALESQVIAQVSQKMGCVISTGGGSVLSDINVKCLKQNGIIIYLKADTDKIINNIPDDSSRPLLNTANKREAIERLMKERSPIYEKSADIIVDTTDKDIGGVMNEIRIIAQPTKQVAIAQPTKQVAIGGNGNDFC